MSQAGLNRIWAQSILTLTAQWGVKHICIAPGSRSTPLSLEALELANYNQVEIHTHFDERGLGFLALGIAKASPQPVAVIVTSGTAVANLLPCVAESGLTGEPLILLTSDRPKDLVGVGANQAIEQIGIFSSHVNQCLDLPNPNLLEKKHPQSLTCVLDKIDLALNEQAKLGGSLHINCPFPEPLYLKNMEEKEQYLPLFADLEAFDTRINSMSFERLDSGINYYQQRVLSQLMSYKGVIVVGNLDSTSAKAVVEFAQKLEWPVLCDPQSGVTSEWAHYDIWLQDEAYYQALSEADCILQFGSRLVSKRLLHWIKEMAGSKNIPYWLFSTEPHVLNPDRVPQLRSQLSVSQALLLLNDAIKDGADFQFKGWASECQSGTQAVDEAISEVTKTPQLNECYFAAHLSDIVDKHPNMQLFIGNSLIVRLMDMFGVIEETEIYTNRGASGIDGLIATAKGVQLANVQPQMTLVGDTSLLYDLNSLALLRQVDKPHIVVVMNNDGGAIFDLLPVPEQPKQDLYQMPHGLTFKPIAQQFQLHYCHAETWQNCQQAIDEYIDKFTCGDTQAALLIEVITPAGQASAHIKQIVKKVTSNA